MFEPQEVHEYIHARFRDAFGPPVRCEGTVDQWSFRPRSETLSVHVLLHGGREGTALWVFDPKAAESVFNTTITQHSQVDELIDRIRRQVTEEASRPAFPSEHASPPTRWNDMNRAGMTEGRWD